MTEAGERRADTTHQRLIAAASRQFARRPYSKVSLDDILAEAELTKRAIRVLQATLVVPRTAAQLALGAWIERIYNRRRRHSALGMLSPAK